MPEYPIELGKEMNPPATADSGIGLRKKGEVQYPSLYLEWEKDYELPEEGTMTVKFKKTSESNRTDKSGTTQSVSLDILEIVSVKGEKAPTVEEPGDRIDALRKQVEELAEEADEDY